MKLLFVILALVCTSACAGLLGNKKSGPMTVDIRVSDLSEDDEKRLEEELKKISGVENIRSDPFGAVTTFTFEFDGSYDRLRRQINNIPYPGLRRQSEVAQLHFEGFDNRAPTIALMSPKQGATVTELKTDVVVEINDTDVETVTINGQNATKSKQNLYGARLTLKEGDNEIAVVAIDKAKNEANEKYSIKVDTTPPDLEATVKVVVEGKVEPGSTVFVDGMEAGVNLFGNWRIELTVKRGQKTVEVVAIDRAGNKKTEQKPIGM